MEQENTYIVATIKPWNIDIYKRKTSKIPGNWHLITEQAKLTPAFVEQVKPRYIFLPHWSWVIPSAILETTECVVFHETNVPYGRGGSPLQNLIARGHTDTVITALRATKGIDEGPVYCQKFLSLAGGIEEIFIRAADITADIISDIIATTPSPTPQKGKVVLFKRRTPEQSRIIGTEHLNKLFDHIRMLDEDTYPRAFIELENLRITFKNPVLRMGKVEAFVEITEIDSND